MAKGTTKVTEVKLGTAEVALGNQFDFPSIIESLDAKLKSMKHITESKYSTSGVLDGIGDIKTETSISALIRAYASVVSREEIYNKAAIELGIESYPVFEVNGGSSESWKRDIKLRIDIINQKETADKLAYFKEKASKFLSADDQKTIFMKEMASFLNGTNL